MSYVKRKVIIILLFTALIHLASYVIIVCKWQNNNPLPHRKHPSVQSIFYRVVTVDIPKNRKILYNLIVCTKENATCFENTPENRNGSGNNSFLDFRWKYSIPDGVERNNNMLCPVIPFYLGPVVDDPSIMHLHALKEMHHLIQPGGIYVPVECTAQQTVAIVVPVPNRNGRTRRYIGSFLYYIHPFLMKQQCEYQIFVVCKDPYTPYKRGELFNVGFLAAQAYRPEGWDCIIFHDIHLVPLDTRNLYRCSRRPRRLVAEFQKPYKFGGAVAMRPEHFKRVNGFSNNQWSNDGEYIDMYRRLLAANFTVEANVPPIGNYTAFDFLKQSYSGPNNAQTDPPNYLKDGLSNITYTINLMDLRSLYTFIEIAIETPSESQKPINNELKSSSVPSASQQNRHT